MSGGVSRVGVPRGAGALRRDGPHRPAALRRRGRLARSSHYPLHMPALSLAADKVVIKEYRENEGLLSLLVAAGSPRPPLRDMQRGCVTRYVCRCLLHV